MKKDIFIFDSCTVLALLKQEDGADDVRQLLKKAQMNKIKIIMSVIQYGEILYISQKYLGQIEFQEFKKNFSDLKIRLINVNKSLTEQAANYKSQGGIAFPDCYVLSTAKEQSAIIVTKDQEFKQFNGLFKIMWLV